MCLIILANDIQSLNYKDLETAYNRNSDGFGVMYLDQKGNFVSDKFCPKNFTEVKNFFNLHKAKAQNQMGIHFRYTTEGKTNRKNCHPFISYNKDNRIIGMMHNGARLPIPLIHKNCSDTWHFNEFYLKSVLKDNPNVILNANFILELEEHIQNDKMLFLDSKSKKFIIVNEKAGNFIGANWFSNDYWNTIKITSKPKLQYDYFDGSFGNNNYDYIFDTPTNEEIVSMSEIQIHNFVDKCIDDGNIFPIVDIIQDYQKYIA